MVGPIGEESIRESNIPTHAHVTDMAAEQMTTFLKLQKILIAERAGNMISADINKEPTRFIASTMITAVIIAIKRLYREVFIPIVAAKS